MSNVRCSVQLKLLNGICVMLGAENHFFNRYLIAICVYCDEWVRPPVASGGSEIRDIPHWALKNGFGRLVILKVSLDT